jgi:hypothetical protein
MVKNFLLGNGERLTKRMDPPKTSPNKKIPYSFEESVKRLKVGINNTLKSIDSLPELACPRNKTVVSFILHPEFTAKSYYPESLFRSLNLEQIGSRITKIKPEKWTKKRITTEVITTEIFVAGEKRQFEEFPTYLSKIISNSAEGDELSKIEAIKPLDISEKLMPILTDRDRLLFEVVLHASASESYLIEGFEKFLGSLEASSIIRDHIFTKGLCFLSLEAEKSNAHKIAEYSFLRVLREMPKLRGFEPMIRSSGISFPVNLPDKEPVDPSLRVAIFDGGIPDKSPLLKWVESKEIDKLDKPFEKGIDHGQLVSSAFLFGSLKEGVSIPQPYAYVDLYRIFDINDKDDDFNLIKVISRIKKILTLNKYNFINISCGPDTPITDTDVHAWTSVLDEILSDGTILATLAAGNQGRKDWSSGNARIQPPSDCVNGLCVGAADCQDEGWQRAPYSSIGPGRLPGYVKPDLLEFGGSSKELFNFVDGADSGFSIQNGGTSFAAPLVLRKAVGIRSIFGKDLNPLTIKALLIHSSDKKKNSSIEVGWGKLTPNTDSITSCDDHCVKVVYQGKLNSGEWLKVPIPLPNDQVKGKVYIKATICYTTSTDPQDPVNYTQSGLEMVFRPHQDKRKDPDQEYPDSKSFFSSSRIYENLGEDDRRFDSHRWETTASSSRSMLGKCLKNSEFNIHYIARDGGNKSKETKEIPYSLVVEVSAPMESNLYNQVFNRYRTILEIIKPKVSIQVQT